MSLNSIMNFQGNLQPTVGLTVAQITSPTAAILADTTDVFSLNTAPYTRYVSSGTALVQLSLGTFFTVGTSTSLADFTTTGVSDDVVINNAIIAVNALGGGTVLVKHGTYNCSNQINMLSGVNLIGEGYGTLIKLPGNFSLKISGKANNLLSNFRVDGTSNTAYCLEVGNSSDVTIDGLWVTNAGNFACFVYSQPGNTTRRVRIINNYLQQTTGLQDCLGGGPTATDVTAVFKDIVIDNNYLVKDMSNGGTNHNAFDMVAMNGCTFTNNTCYGRVVTGTEQDFNYQTKVTNNTVHPAIGDSSGYLAIQMKATGTVTSGILVSNNIVDQGYLKVDGASGHVTKQGIISNNIVYSTSADNGIWTNQTDAMVITGNVVIGTLTAGKFGILIQSSTNTICNNNYVNGYDNNIFDNTLSITNIITDNISINFISASVVAAGATPNNMGANPEIVFAQGNITGATVFNRANGNVITATFTGNVTATITSPPGSRVGDELTLILTQGGGGNTITKPSNVKLVGGAFSPSAGAGAVDSWTLVFDGSNWREKSRALNQT